MTDTFNTSNGMEDSPEDKTPDPEKRENKGGGEKKVLPKKRTSLSFWISIILGILFLLSAGTNVMLFLLLGVQGIESSDSPSLREEKFLSGDKHSKNKVLLIPVEGVILEVQNESLFYEEKSIVKEITDELRGATNDKDIKGIIFSVNSPGGGITECDNIYTEILKFKEERPEVPIIVSMGGVAASGGYYIAAPAEKIYAQPTTITGSIGVIMQVTNIAELFEKIGLENITFKSGKMKDIGSATREMTPEEKKIIDNMVKEMSGRFIQIIKDNREFTDDQLAVISDARIFTAQQAKDIGLIDEIGYLEDAFRSVKEMANISDAKLVKKKKLPTLFSFLEETSENLNPESEIQEEIRDILTCNPRLMYLWTVY